MDPGKIDCGHVVTGMNERTNELGINRIELGTRVVGTRRSYSDSNRDSLF